MIIADAYAFDAEFELPVGIAQAAASGSHLTSGWEFTHVVTVKYRPTSRYMVTTL
jgi:hypothetical protein